MKFVHLVCVVLLIGCGGSLSDEQRKQMHEKMEVNKIVRVTEIEIVEAAYAEGRKIVNTLDSLHQDSARLKAFIHNSTAEINFLTPDATHARVVEKQLIDAYLSDTSGTFQDNIQNLRNAGGTVDSLLYTKPLTKKLPDGSDQLMGVWNVRLSKKNLVIEIGKKKEM